MSRFEVSSGAYPNYHRPREAQFSVDLQELGRSTGVNMVRYPALIALLCFSMCTLNACLPLPGKAPAELGSTTTASHPSSTHLSITISPSPTSSQRPPVEVFSWEAAQTAAALGTPPEGLTIETATSYPSITPTVPPGYDYFALPKRPNGRAFFTFEVVTWRLLTDQELAEMKIEGEFALMHRQIPDCRLSQLFGRGWGGEMQTEIWEFDRMVVEIRLFLSGDPLVVRFITFPELAIYLEVPPYQWQSCLSDAKDVLQTYIFIPSSE